MKKIKSKNIEQTIINLMMMTGKTLSSWSSSTLTSNEKITKYGIFTEFSVKNKNRLIFSFHSFFCSTITIIIILRLRLAFNHHTIAQVLSFFIVLVDNIYRYFQSAHMQCASYWIYRRIIIKNERKSSHLSTKRCFVLC